MGASFVAQHLLCTVINRFCLDLSKIIESKGVKKRKFVQKNFLPSLWRFLPSKKSTSDMISQCVTKNTFYVTWTQNHLKKNNCNKNKHLLLLWQKNFILHKYHIFFPLIHTIYIYFFSIACLSKTKDVYNCISFAYYHQ